MASPELSIPHLGDVCEKIPMKLVAPKTIRVLASCPISTDAGQQGGIGVAANLALKQQTTFLRQCLLAVSPKCRRA
jgi:hypothetical protein